MGKKYTTNFLEDTNGSTGSSNQVLISTPTGIDWVDGSGSSIIGGPYLPLTAGSGKSLTGTLYGTSTNWSGSGDYAGSLTLGTGASTQEAHLQIGQGRTGNGYSYIDLIGDATYTDYGLRVIRNNTGANTSSAIIHRGTGNLEIQATDSASILLRTNNTTALTLSNTQNATFAGDVNITNSKLQITAAAPEILFSVPSGGLDSRIYNDGSGNFIIGNGTNSSTPTERMRVNQYGQLLVNATSSGYGSNLYGYNLGVKGNTSQAFISICKSNQTLDTQGIIIGVDNNSAYFISRDNKPIDFYNNNTIKVRIDTSGRVGIGTTSPDRKLHVRDSAIVVSEFEGTNTGSLLDLVNSNASQLYNGIRFTQGTSSKMAVTHIADGTTKGYVQIGNSWTTGSEILVVDGRTSKVGIGTTSPSVQLDIEDSSNVIVDMNTTTANANTTIRLQESGTVKATIGYDGTNDGLILTTGGFTAGNGIFIDDTQKVGIGTTSPGYKLTVNGDVDVNNGAILAAQAYGINLGVSGYDIVMPTTTRIAIKTSGSERVSILNTGNVGIGNTNPQYPLHFGDISGYYISIGSGNSTPGGNTPWLGVFNNNSITSATYGWGIYDSSADGSFQIWNRAGNTTGYNTFTIKRGGNVGIGTTSIDASSPKLEVSGSIMSTSSSLTAAPTAASVVMDYHSPSNAGRIMAGSGGSWNKNLSLVPYGGNVGIGTTSPNAKLVVKGSGLVSQDFFHIEDSGGIRMLEVTSDGAGNSNLQVKDTAGATKSLINSAGNSYFNGGNVGIGTTSPSKPLHVNGGGLNFVAEFQSTDDKASILIQDDDTLNYIHSQDGYLSLGGQATLSASNLNINSSSGNVGIGTPGPSEKLHVNAGTSNTVALFESTDARSRIVLKDNSGEVHLNAIGDNITFETSASGTERMRITSAGNVGIGTTSPSTRFEVAASATTSVDIAHFSNSNDVVKIKHALDGVGSGRVSIFDASNNEDVRLSAQSNSWFNAGNVGIGTTSPSEKLAVQSSFANTASDSYVEINSGHEASGGSDVTGVAGLLFKQAGSGNVLRNAGSIVSGRESNYSTDNTADSYLTFSTAQNNVNAERIRISSNGSVGINSTSSSYKLDVGGNARFLDSVYINTSTGSGGLFVTRLGGASESLKIYTTDSSSYLDVYQDENQSGYGNLLFRADDTGDKDGYLWFGHRSRGEAMRIIDNGNVGIGTASPSQKLHVAGNLRVTGAYYDSNNSPGTANQVLVSTVTGTDWVDGSGSSIIGGPYLPLAGGTLTGDLTISKAATPLFKLLDTTNNISLLLGADDANTFIRSSSSANLYLQPGGSTALTLLSGGNVGIGTTSPTGKLHVEGQIRLFKNGDDALANSGVYIANAANNRAYNFQQNADGSSLNLYAYGGVSWANRVTFKANGNVGIGTTLPIGKLNVSKDSTTDGLSQAITVSSSSVSTKRMNLGYVPGSNYAFIDVINYAINNTNQALSLQPNGGKVGIGTTLPTTALTIRKAISPTAYGEQASMIEFKSYYTGYDTETVKSAIYSGVSDQTGLQTTRGFMSFWTADFVSGGGQSLTEKMRIESNGNVGIGTTNPEQNLHISSGASTGLLLESTFSTSGKKWLIQSRGADSSFQIYNETDSVDALRILSNGNVGIGTTSPSDLLSLATTSGDCIIGLNGNSSGDPEIHMDSGNNRSGNIKYGDGSTLAMFRYDHSDVAFKFYAHNQTIVDFQVGENTSFFATSNVGIGLTNPGQKLEVSGNIKAHDGYIRSEDGATGDFMQIFNDGANTGQSFITTSSLDLVLRPQNGVLQLKGENYGSGNNASLQIYNALDASVKVKLNSNGVSYLNGGNVGIGVTAPAQKLHVGNGGIRVEKFATGLGGFITIGNATETAGNYSAYFFGNTPSDTNYFKGGIAYETLSATFGRGDMHFLQNDSSDATNATISDSVMTILNNGNVGIGTTSPSRTLHVSTDSGVLIKGASGSTNAKISLLPASGGRQYDLGNVGSDFRIFDASANVTRMYFDNDGNTGIGTTSPGAKLDVAGIIFAGDGNKATPGYSFASDPDTGMFRDSANVLVLGVNADTRIRISNTDIVTYKPLGVNTTSITSGVALDVGGNVLLGSSGVGDLYLGNYATANHFRFHTNNSNTYFDMNCGDIYWRQGASTRYTFFPSTANMTVNGTITQLSDIRNKENIVEISDCISKVQAMRGVYYNRTDFNTDVTKVGVIAQEVEDVLPELIIESPEDGLKSVAYSELTAVLINAIKEQQEIIEDLKTRITKLEN